MHKQYSYRYFMCLLRWFKEIKNTSQPIWNSCSTNTMAHHFISERFFLKYHLKTKEVNQYKRYQNDFFPPLFSFLRMLSITDFKDDSLYTFWKPIKYTLQSNIRTERFFLKYHFKQKETN